jgi:hypothetical protein
MATTQADVDTLKAARNNPASELQLSDKRVRFRTIEELDRAIASAEAEVAAAAGTKRIRQVRLYGSKGL